MIVLILKPRSGLVTKCVEELTVGAGGVPWVVFSLCDYMDMAGEKGCVIISQALGRDTEVGEILGWELVGDHLR